MQILLVVITFLLGLVSGVVMHRSDFCLAGMFRDLFLFRSSPLLRSLVLLVAANMLLFALAQFFGLITPGMTMVLTGPPALTNLFGGMLFGLGMVLAGGCVIGVLYKVGAGSLPSVFAIVGLIIGSAVYAEFHPLWTGVAKATRLSVSRTLPELFGLPALPTLLMVFLLLAFMLLRWQQRGLLVRPNVISGYLQPRTTALVLALISLLSFVLLGMPLGIATIYAKTGAFLEQLVFPKHVAGLVFFNFRGLAYYSPLLDQRLTFGSGPFLDGLSLVQIPLLVGIICGAAVSAVTLKKYMLSFHVPKRQLLSALVGGVIMGLAARMAPACNVWHLLGGLPLLSLQSLLFTLGLLPGAGLGSWLLVRYVLPGR